MRLGWLSDIHLDHASDATLASFLSTLGTTTVDAWILSGDIAEAPSVVPMLSAIEDKVSARVYFTLGNHDFYRGSFLEVAGEVDTLVRRARRLVWLTTVEPQMLGFDVALVGDDSWADARLGNPDSPRVEVSDFYLIRELTGLSRDERVVMLNQLGDEAAARLAPKLRAAAEERRRVVVAVHVPPFREATWHEGRVSSDDWLPWFSCRAVGDVILSCARDFPNRRFLVLCGHTHSSGTCQPAPNVRVMTAQAAYGSPALQAVFDTRDADLFGSA